MMKQPSRRRSPNQVALWSRFELIDWQARGSGKAPRAYADAGILRVSGSAGSKASRNHHGTKRPVRAHPAVVSHVRSTLLAELALTWLEC